MKRVSKIRKLELCGIYHELLKGRKHWHRGRTELKAGLREGDKQHQKMYRGCSELTV